MQTLLFILYHSTMETISQVLPYANFILIIVSGIYYIKEIVIPFKKQSHIERTENIQITRGNYYRAWDNSKIEVNLNKSKKALEEHNYDRAIKFLSKALLISIDIDTKSNVNLWNKIHEIEKILGR